MNERVFQMDAARIVSFAQTHKYIFLFGAGVYAKAMLLFFQEANIKLHGCCVTRRESSQIEAGICQAPVYEIRQIPYPLEQCGFVFAMKKKFQNEVVTDFEHRGEKVYYLTVSDDFLRYYHTYAKYLFCLSLRDQQEIVSSYTFFAGCRKLLDKTRRGIILKRTSGLGDVLCLEPVIRELNRLTYQVFLATQWDELFAYNHCLEGLFPSNGVPEILTEHWLVVDCHNAHEMRPMQSMLDGYSAAVAELIPTFHLPSQARIPIYDAQLIKDHDIRHVQRICINNEATNWASRIFARDKMIAFANYLLGKGYELYEIGSDSQNYLGVGKNCYGLALHDTAKLMSEMDLYVGVDNGLMHIAQSLHLPVFILFGCTCPNFRIYDWSRARIMWKNVAKLSCAACYHRRAIPCRKVECHWDTVRCMDWSVEEVIEAFETEKYDNPPKLQDEMYKPIWWADMEEE